MSSLLRFQQDKTEADVDRAVRDLARTAYRHVAFYRRLWNERGVRPESIRSRADLARLPIVEKAALFGSDPRDRVDDRASLGRCLRTTTSGSTGFPVVIHMSRTESVARRVVLYRAWGRAARLPWLLRVADVGTWVRSPQGVVTVRRGPATIARVSLALPVERQLAELARLRPHVVSGYPTALQILADALRESGLDVHPRLVATRGEVLTSDARRAIEEAFGAPVGDFYNCEEAGNIAWPCPRDAGVLHVNVDACVVEIVDEDGLPSPAGREGRVLLTSLLHRTTPLLRYDVRDRSAWIASDGGRCACGSRAPALRAVAGRQDDLVVLPDGRRLSPRLVATAVDRGLDEVASARGVERLYSAFRIVQYAPDRVTVEIVPTESTVPELEPALGRVFARFHSDLSCSVRLVEAIPRDASGKVRKVVQQIGADVRRAPGGI